MRPSMLLICISVFSDLRAGAADGCFDLWVECNGLYKAYGYCFKTRKAINYFGNAGCLYDNAGTMPMSGADKSRVLALKKREKQLGCL